MRKIFIIPVLVFSIIAISFSIQYASASFILELIGSDPFFSQECKALDSAATVSPSTKTCDVHNITINDGQTLQIGKGVTLIVENSFTNNGNVRVVGTLDLNTGSLLTNNGHLDLSNDGSLTVNGGSINLGGNGLLDINDGIFNFNGGTLTMSDNAKETIHGDSLVTKSGNTQVIINGDNTITINGNGKETVNGNENIIINGQRTEIVNGKEFITIHGDRTETVSGKETVTIHGSRTVTVDGNEKITITGQRTQTVSGKETITVRHDRTEFVSGKEFITIHGDRTETVEHDETITIHGSRTETVDHDQTITIGGHKTETISSGGTLTIGGHSKETIGPNTTIIVDKGGTIIVDKGITLSNGGIIDISGLMTNNGKVENFNSIVADCGGIFSGNSPTGNPITVQCLGPPQVTILASPTPVVVGTQETLSATIIDPGCPACTPSSFSYAWTLSSPPGSSSVISSPSVPSPSFTPDLPGNYQVSLVVTDSLGHSSPQTFLTLSASSCGTCVPTVSPTASPNPANIGTPVALDANPSDAGCPACIPSFTYNWSLLSPPSSTSVLSDPTLRNPTFTPDVVGSYQLSVTAIDSLGHSSAQMFLTLSASCGSCVVTVSPMASPNPDTIGTPVTLDANPSDTGCNLPTSISYNWSISSAPAGSSATLSDPTVQKPTITPDMAGDWLFGISVTDACGVSSVPSSVKLTVTPSTLTHSNGLGQTYTDPSPLGTYTATTALEAALAWGHGTPLLGICPDSSQASEVTGDGFTAVWAYTGPAAGHVLLVTGNNAFCPTTSDPTWN